MKNPTLEQINEQRVQMEKNWARVPKPMVGENIEAVVLLQSIRLRNDNRPPQVIPYPPGTLIEGPDTLEKRFGSVGILEATVDVLNGMSRKKPQARVVLYRLPGSNGEVVRLLSEHDVAALDPVKRKEMLKNHPGPKDVSNFPELPDKKKVKFVALDNVYDSVAARYVDWTVSEVPADSVADVAGEQKLAKVFLNGCWLVKLDTGNLFLFNLKSDAESFLQANEPYRKLL